jgi:pimeloyl-ACP methyl ester carboxylesterase
MCGVQPTVRFTKSGDVNIAYGVVGDGPVDLVWVPGWVSNLEIPWEDPSYARFLDRLASFSRLIVFDKRGTGLSDRVPVSELPNLEQRMDDVRAVMDAAGSERAVLFGASEGGPMSALFAATYPQRTQAVIMYGAYASFLAADGYPWGWGRDAFEQFLKTLEELWDDLSPTLFVWAPSVSDDPGARRYWTRFIRMGASPAAINALTPDERAGRRQGHPPFSAGPHPGDPSEGRPPNRRRLRPIPRGAHPRGEIRGAPRP